MFPGSSKEEEAQKLLKQLLELAGGSNTIKVGDQLIQLNITKLSPEPDPPKNPFSFSSPPESEFIGRLSITPKTYEPIPTHDLSSISSSALSSPPQALAETPSSIIQPPIVSINNVSNISPPCSITPFVSAVQLASSSVSSEVPPLKGYLTQQPPQNPAFAANPPQGIRQKKKPSEFLAELKNSNIQGSNKVNPYSFLAQKEKSKEKEPPIDSLPTLMKKNSDKKTGGLASSGSLTKLKKSTGAQPLNSTSTTLLSINHLKD
jgi:hypothetical protein